MSQIQEFLSSNIASFLWSLSAFVVFVLLLLKLGVKHILAAVDAREAKIAHELGEAEATFLRAKATQADLDAKMRAAEARIAELMAEGRRDAEAIKGKLVEQGRMEIDALRTRALREIEGARHAALVGLRSEIADISIAVAEKVLRSRLDASHQEALVSTALDAAYAARLADFQKAEH